MQNETHNRRAKIYNLCNEKQGFNQKDIALIIGKDKSVVSRELSRNCDKRSKKYDADLAHRKYQQRQKIFI